MEGECLNGLVSGGGGQALKPDKQKKGHFGLNHTLLPLDLMILFGF